MHSPARVGGHVLARAWRSASPRLSSVTVVRPPAPVGAPPRPVTPNELVAGRRRTRSEGGRAVQRCAVFSYDDKGKRKPAKARG